jgi:hypothetical protein
MPTVDVENARQVPAMQPGEGVRKGNSLPKGEHAINADPAGKERSRMMRKILAVSLCVVLSLISISFAECPSADLTGDYFVNFEDYAVLAG